MTQVFQKYLNKLEDVDEYSIDADDLLQIFQTSIDAIQAKGIQENLQGSHTAFRPHPKEALYLFTDLLAANSVSTSEEQDEKEQDAHKVSGAIEILQRFAGSTALSVVFDGEGEMVVSGCDYSIQDWFQDPYSPNARVPCSCQVLCIPQRCTQISWESQNQMQT